jgi:hypothetical protein
LTRTAGFTSTIRESEKTQNQVADGGERVTDPLALVVYMDKRRFEIQTRLTMLAQQARFRAGRATHRRHAKLAPFSMIESCR